MVQTEEADEPEKVTASPAPIERPEQNVAARKTVSQALREWDARALENAQKPKVDAGKAFIDVIKTHPISENHDLLSDTPGIGSDRIETPIIKPIYFNKE